MLVKKVGGRRKVVVVWEVDGGGGGSRVAWNRKKKLSSKIRHTDQNHTAATHPTCYITSSCNAISHIIHSTLCNPLRKSSFVSSAQSSR